MSVTSDTFHLLLSLPSWDAAFYRLQLFGVLVFVSLFSMLEVVQRCPQSLAGGGHQVLRKSACRSSWVMLVILVLLLLTSISPKLVKQEGNKGTARQVNRHSGGQQSRETDRQDRHIHTIFRQPVTAIMGRASVHKSVWCCCNKRKNCFWESNIFSFWHQQTEPDWLAHTNTQTHTHTHILQGCRN